MTAIADIGWNWANSYATLPGDFYTHVKPRKFPKPQLLFWNQPLARELGLNGEAITEHELALIFSGQQIPDGTNPLSQAYAGHQYGGFTNLGDGRAILLGEQRTPGGRLVDIQWKGPGHTPYSRSGDGLAAVGPMLREVIISEAMHALGIPTTRSLAVVATGERVFRQTVLPGAVLTRVAASHLRVGTFQYASARGQHANLQALADYAIARHYPQLQDEPEKYMLFLQAVIDRQSALIAHWQLVGFVHGVMNTDNMTISGETIDYGPCAFMEAYDPDTVFSSIDHQGRYAYGNQPAIAQWNLARFAETLLPLMDDTPEVAVEKATSLIHDFPKLFRKYWLAGLQKKLGLNHPEESDSDLILGLFDIIQNAKADYTNTFRGLSADPKDGSELWTKPEFLAWQQQWHARLAAEKSTLADAQARMVTINPDVIPRNQLVEQALQVAEQGELQLFQEILAVVQQPFSRMVRDSKFYQPGAADSPRYRTFCGT